MKILLLSHIFPPAIDGGSKVIYKLGQYLKSQNHQTLYVSSNCSSTDDFVKSKYKKISAINDLSSTIYLPVYHHFRRPLKLFQIICTNFLFINPNSYFINLIKIFQKGPIFKIIPFLKAIHQILKFKPDLIIAGPLPTTIILYAELIKKISRIYNLRPKILLNASFHPTDQDFQQKPLINTLKKADYLWALTQSETDYFIKNFNIDPQKIILAGNGVDENFLTTKKISTTYNLRSNILFIGSLASHKRVDLLIKSFSTIYNLRSNASLTIAGQKTLYYPQIEKLIKSLDPKTKAKIKFIFDFKSKDLAKIIDNCSVLILPSVQESFGLVIIEAWARQKPVICADIPALKELVKKSNGGLLFKADDQNDLTKQIQFILDNPQKAQQLGQNGYDYVKNNYTWKKVGHKICQEISF